MAENTKTLDITVIIPIHSVANEKTGEYLDIALNSISVNEVKPKEVLIVRCGCGDVREFLNEFDLTKYNLNAHVIENITGKSFQNQMNYAVSQVTTEYFSLLEFDDEYASNWFKNVGKYMEKNPDIDMFLPIVSDVDQNNKFLMMTNEAAWAYNFSEEMGVIDNETLINFPNINIDGMVTKKESYLAAGGIKPSIKLSFNYEFLLRFTKNGYKIMVVPKIGYKHVNMRTDSLFWNYKNDPVEKISPDEAKFWMELAQKEYYYKQDRNVIYAPTTQDTELTNG
jgi:GT2 family glycosyltransferase